jgi:hypothetical protein
LQQVVTVPLRVDPIRVDLIRVELTRLDLGMRQVSHPVAKGGSRELLSHKDVSL